MFIVSVCMLCCLSLLSICLSAFLYLYDCVCVCVCVCVFTCTYFVPWFFIKRHTTSLCFSGKKAFPTLYSQYCQGVDALSRQIIERHNNILMTSILHDAESNFWQDSKEFYEVSHCTIRRIGNFSQNIFV